MAELEFEERHLDVIYELILRGLRETPVWEREYGEAFDAFVDAAGYPRRIGDQPERVQDVWNEILEESAKLDRRRQSD